MVTSPHQTAAILVIGNEVLSGRTRDANAWFAAKTLFDVGCKLCEVVVVPDAAEQIIGSLQRLRQSYDAVITSGGIGPTHDDITMQCIADSFAVPLLEHAQTMQLMENFFGADNFNEGRRRMARLPQGATPVVCEQTIAPGALIDNVYVFAGVPQIFESQLCSVLEHFRGSHAFIRHEIEVNVAESVFAAGLSDIQQQFSELEIGSYPGRCGNNPNGKICISGINEDTILQAAQAIELMLKEKNHS